MCGSGTLPIEAAMIALDRAPGLKRGFDMEKWDCVDKAALDEIRREAQERFERAKAERNVEIYGSDIDSRVLNLALAHRAQAGLNDVIHFEKKALKDAQLPAERGAVVTNPPYGERLGDARAAEQIYRELGMLMRGHDDWTLTAITSSRDFEKAYGKRCTKRRRVYNGRIECEILSYMPHSDRVAKERKGLPEKRDERSDRRKNG